ncbi:alcohol dehydrogenase catalytic domain-containing protein, partial [Streptomyces sp. NPDC005195]|uniref:alcohol dehydrogenase catalytic domain-containing protein n=1 Tax=Streptomyces sp. NPDC005195 TaxID=3154561 RepID=UPI0033A3968A
MHAWEVVRPGPIERGPLRFVERPVPVPRADELLVHVRTCGVCRTDLHVSEGDLPVRRPRVTPGHEVVGVVATAGEDVRGFA